MKNLNTVAWLTGAAWLVALVPAASPAQQPVTLTLGDAARLAAERSSRSEAARLRMDMAEARVRQQRAALLPSISAALRLNQRTFNTAELGLAVPDPATGRDLFDPRGQVLGPVQTWDIRATVTQSLVDLSSLTRIRAARAAVVAASEDATSASQQAAAAAALSYIRALRAEAQLSARHSDDSLAEDLLRIARGQRKAGLGTALDVTRAEVQLATVRAQLIRAAAAEERARLELHRALGIPFDASLTLADSLPVTPTTPALPSDTTASERALSTRGDVRASRAQLVAAERQLSAIKAERIPTISAFASRGPTGNGVERLLSTYSWGVQISIPLLDGLRREGRLEEQRLVIRELDTYQRDLEQQVQLEVRIALLDLSSSRREVEAAAERVALAEQELTLAQRRFAEGVAGNADVITALLALSVARTQMVDARAALQIARVALADAEGVVTELP